MKVFFSGISGTGLGPLAMLAHDAGFEVKGSDKAAGAISAELKENSIEVDVSEEQDGKSLKEFKPDWFVYTSALPDDHPELKWAEENVEKVTKRDEFTNFLIKKLNLKLVAVAGTHGKTTTTSMIIWVAKQLNLPVSYVAGTTLGFAPSGAYHDGDRYFVYECDEYDRNFLKFHPWLALIPYVSYDHPDTYPTKNDYLQAFYQFLDQSKSVILSRFPGVQKFLNHDQTYKRAKSLHLSPGMAKSQLVDDRMISVLTLSGAARRRDAGLAVMGLFDIVIDMFDLGFPLRNPMEIFEPINSFPGVGRRFEKISNGFYSDYAHHPEEISATLEIAREEAENTGKKGIVVLYEPHQNSRQHLIAEKYEHAFDEADRIFWLPTYLVREDPNLDVLKPEDLIQNLSDPGKAVPAELDENLAERLKELEKDGSLVLLLSAGPADSWFRAHFA